MTLTNETTRRILKFFFLYGVFAYRNSVGGGAASYTTKTGDIHNRFVQFGKSGSPDIIAILPKSGRFLGVEVKTGRDRLRPEQIGFISNARRMGAEVLVVKDFNDFLSQWNQLS